MTNSEQKGARTQVPEGHHREQWRYANRYHFYFRFDGDRQGRVREYNDVNHAREVFMA